MPDPFDISVSYEHPVADQLINGLRAICNATGMLPPNPLVVPPRMYRAIAIAANDTATVGKNDRIELTLEVDTNVVVTLQPEGWLQGTKVPWKWILTKPRKDRRRRLANH